MLCTSTLCGFGLSKLRKSQPKMPMHANPPVCISSLAFHPVPSLLAPANMPAYLSTKPTSQALGKPFTLWTSFVRFYEQLSSLSFPPMLAPAKPPPPSEKWNILTKPSTLTKIMSQALGKPFTLWTSFARFYERHGSLDNARVVFEKATAVEFKYVDVLA